MRMRTPKFKELRLKLLSVSVIVTLIAMVIIQGLLYLHENKYLVLPDIIRETISSIRLVIATMFFTSLFLRLTLKRVFNFFDEPEERIFYSKIYSWTLYSVGIFVILYHFGVSLGNITIFIGLIATGFAFALRDVLLSFFGWMILLRKKPFRIGDYIKIGDDEGTVQHIGTFYVLLDRSYELPDVYTRVPNRIFLEKSISKMGKDKLHERLGFQLKRIPANWKESAAELKADINKHLKNNLSVNIYFDMPNDKLLLVVEYLVSIDDKLITRSEVIGLAFSRFGDDLHLAAT
jgi:MscS family membrane protein